MFNYDDRYGVPIHATLSAAVRRTGLDFRLGLGPSWCCVNCVDGDRTGGEREGGGCLAGFCFNSNFGCDAMRLEMASGG